jgi:hypothetical protein
MQWHSCIRPEGRAGGRSEAACQGSRAARVSVGGWRGVGVGGAPCARAWGRRGSSRSPAPPLPACHRSAGRGTAARPARPCAPPGPAPGATNRRARRARCRGRRALCRQPQLLAAQAHTQALASPRSRQPARTLMTTAVTDRSTQKYVPDLRGGPGAAVVGRPACMAGSSSSRRSGGVRERPPICGATSLAPPAPLGILLRELAHDLQALGFGRDRGFCEGSKRAMTTPAAAAAHCAPAAPGGLRTRSCKHGRHPLVRPGGRDAGGGAGLQGGPPSQGEGARHVGGSREAAMGGCALEHSRNYIDSSLGGPRPSFQRSFRVDFYWHWREGPDEGVFIWYYPKCPASAGRSPPSTSASSPDLGRLVEPQEQCDGGDGHRPSRAMVGSPSPNADEVPSPSHSEHGLIESSGSGLEWACAAEGDALPAAAGRASPRGSAQAVSEGAEPYAALPGASQGRGV